nr:DUF3394 domain-containing protein [Deltaproteobacteria bacterium]
FWATVFMIVILLTQRPILSFFRGSGGVVPAAAQGVKDLLDSLVGGARNMIGIGVATAAAGIVVGTVTLTGIGLVMTDLVEFLSGGNLLLMLILTAVISLILGMGLPTTANYIVVSTLMAPVIVNLGAQHGLIVPLVAVHLFVFYFGIMADDTPPVGLAAYAAAGISHGDPIMTGVQGFLYDIRTGILPFMFIFNTQILLIDIPNAWQLILTVVGSAGAMLVFAAATQGFWLVKSRWWETAVLLLVAFSLFRPGFWMDRLYHPITQMEPTRVAEVAREVEPFETMRLRVKGETYDGRSFNRIMVLTLEDQVEDGTKRLQDAGLVLRVDDDKRVFIDQVVFGSNAQKAGFDFDWELLSVEREENQPPKHLMYIPAAAVLALIGLGQWRRKKRLGIA